MHVVFEYYIIFIRCNLFHNIARKEFHHSRGIFIRSSSSLVLHTKYQKYQRNPTQIVSYTKDILNHCIHRLTFIPVCAGVIMAFDLRENVRQLLSTRSTGPRVLQCLHGLRVLSLLWVVLCQTYRYLDVRSMRKMLIMFNGCKYYHFCDKSLCFINLFMNEDKVEVNVSE